MFSVLMSLYDKEKPEYLDLCLESLYKQTLSADEIVLVYDGYINPKLDDIVKKWCASLPIKIIKLEKNVGLGQALNKGLEHCTHEIVARMDTDDICDTRRFEKQILLMQNDSELSILGSDIEEFEERKEIITSYRHVPKSTSAVMKAIKFKSPFNHMTVMFKKSHILAVGGYQEHYYMEDYNLWLRLMAKGYKAINIPEYLVTVRVGRDMLSRRRGLKYVGSELKLARLKKKLGYLGFIESIYIFAIRSLPRIMPIFIMKHIYKIARTH